MSVIKKVRWPSLKEIDLCSYDITQGTISSQKKESIIYHNLSKTKSNK